MLPDQRRRAEDPSRSFRKPDQIAELLHLSQLLMLERDQQTMLAHFGVIEHLAREGFVGYLAGNAGPIEDFEPLGGGSRRQQMLEFDGQSPVVGAPRLFGGEARVPHQMLRPGHLREGLPLSLSDNGDAQPSVG